MYVHAYQSYLWNSVVSERIRLLGADKPAVGDLVYAGDSAAPKAEITKLEAGEGAEEEPGAEESEKGSNTKKGKKQWVAPQVKTLAAEDLANYTIHDVIMPLPGRDVDYPGGVLGDRYRELITADGLDPANWSRPQK
jgi:tRNA pseudouridine13 synthase